MNPTAHLKNRADGKRDWLLRRSGWLVTCMLFAGCATPERTASQSKSDDPPENIFCSHPILPASLQRVAVLPLACERPGGILSESCETLNPILSGELIRTKKFEVVSVSPEMLRRCTGRADWTGAEILPADFFSVLQREYGCDAVLFCQLTAFRAYAPLTIGWRLKLVDVRTRQIIWAGDEVFATKQPAVGVGAWLAEQGRHLAVPELDEEWTMQNSPSRFGHASAARLLATLPER